MAGSTKVKPCEETHGAICVSSAILATQKGKIMGAVKFTFGMSFADIDAGITSIKGRSAKLRKEMHQMNVSVLAQWEKTGDVRQPLIYAAKIVNEMDYHSQAIADWFATYAGFVWDAKTKAFTATQNTITMDTVKAAKAESFEQLSPPKAVQPLNILAKLDALITSADKRLQASEDKRNPEDKVSLDDLKALRDARAVIAARYA